MRRVISGRSWHFTTSYNLQLLTIIMFLLSFFSDIHLYKLFGCIIRRFLLSNKPSISLMSGKFSKPSFFFTYRRISNFRSLSAIFVSIFLISSSFFTCSQLFRYTSEELHFPYLVRSSFVRKLPASHIFHSTGALFYLLRMNFSRFLY